MDDRNAMASALALNARIDGSLAHAGQVDNYTFTLAAYSRLYFDALTDDVRFTWSLVGPRGTVVSNRNFQASDSTDLSGNPVLSLAAGAYTLGVDGATAWPHALPTHSTADR
jgi:hypothetical protein